MVTLILIVNDGSEWELEEEYELKPFQVDKIRTHCKDLQTENQRLKQSEWSHQQINVWTPPNG